MSEQKKPSRPRPLKDCGNVYAAAFESTGLNKGEPFIVFKEASHYLNARECRKLGEWLIKAAQYMEAKGK